MVSSLSAAPCLPRPDNQAFFTILNVLLTPGEKDTAGDGRVLSGSDRQKSKCENAKTQPQGVWPHGHLGGQIRRVMGNK